MTNKERAVVALKAVRAVLSEKGRLGEISLPEARDVAKKHGVGIVDCLALAGLEPVNVNAGHSSGNVYAGLDTEIVDRAIGRLEIKDRRYRGSWE